MYRIQIGLSLCHRALAQYAQTLGCASHRQDLGH
ncbi:Uncharacterised protein [Vibrio cholerae]|nr:Uncharacterised protein [Vibrio cholerae]